jgi:XTP/dITP diphosphohydrolase
MRKFSDSSLLIATHNAGKLEEMTDLLRPFGINVKSAKEFDLGEPEETENTFVGNARIKAHAAAKATGLPSLADDSGIEIDALDRAPGVYTADWAETPNGRDFVMAMSKSYEKIIETGSVAPWTARFCSTLVLAWPDGHDEVFVGQREGQFVGPMRGEEGHGYDPIFQPEGYEITFGEMDRWEKNKISHRGKAFQKLVKIFGT